MLTTSVINYDIKKKALYAFAVLLSYLSAMEVKMVVKRISTREL